MGRQSVLSVAILFVLNLTVRAEGLVRLTLQQHITRQSGYTEYEMDIRYPLDTAPGGIKVLRSELKFPLDVTMAGVRGVLESTAQGLYAWSVAVGYSVNSENPEDLMQDSDWSNLRSVEPEKYIYTESPAQMRSTMVTAETTLRVVPQRQFNLDLWGGFRYQKIEQDIIGYRGWALDNAFDTVLLFDTTSLAMFYRVEFTTAYLGCRANFHPTPHLKFSGQAAFALVWASDFDDHHLRNKEADADIDGTGAIFGVNLGYRIPVQSVVRPFVEFVGDLAYYRASGGQTQSWYGDDPATPDKDETGTSISGIPHEIRSLRGSVGVRVGVGF